MSAPNGTTEAPLKLGWVEGPEDPRTLKLANYAGPAAFDAAPAAADYMSKVTKWPILGNNRYGCCVLVSTAHLVQGWTTYASTPVLIPERDVLAAYSAITGFDPRTGRNDNGTNSLDAMNYWRKRGIGGRKIAAYVQIDHKNPVEMKTALHLFGGIYVAAQLPQSADTQFRQRKPWTVVRAGGARGSWGGHAIRMGAYDADGITVSTWGRKQRATWDWWAKYGSEAFAVISADQLNPQGQSPLGFAMDKLREDLANITRL